MHAARHTPLNVGGSRAVEAAQVLANSHLDDDGSPPAKHRRRPTPFTIRDTSCEPRRDVHELGGES
jgi:hypothetical protein